MTRFIRLFLTCAGFAGAAAAQTNTSQTLAALLAEVRQLRVAVERAMSIGPRVQLLLQRVQIQETKVTRLSRDLQDIRNQITDVTNEASTSDKSLEEFAERAKEEQNPALRQALDERLRATKSQIEALKAREQQWRVRASEIASELQVEQSKLDVLEAQLDRLEKQLEAALPR